MASQKILLAMVITAVGVFSVGKAQSDLPIVKEADCEKIPLIKYEKCLIIEFKSDAPVVEYAGLDPTEDKFPNILNGQLFNSDLDEILDSMVTASIEKDGTTAEVKKKQALFKNSVFLQLKQVFKIIFCVFFSGIDPWLRTNW